MFKDLCTPAHLYLVLSIIAIIIGIFHKFSAMALLVKMFWVALWTYLLNFLCKKGLSTVAWIFVVLPFIAMFASIILVLEGHKVHHLVVTNKEGMGTCETSCKTCKLCSKGKDDKK
jgi:hypothetical protein